MEGEGGGRFLIPPSPQWPAWSLRRKCEFGALLDCPFADIMASNITFDLTRDGKVFKLRIAEGDMTVSRLFRAFQAIHMEFAFGVLKIN